MVPVSLLKQTPNLGKYSPLSHGGHIVQGDQKSFVLPCQALQWKNKVFCLAGQYGRHVTREN